MATRPLLHDQSEGYEHLVQLYGSDDRSLVENVGEFLREGLRRGDGLLVVATAEHNEAFIQYLKTESGYSRATLEGRLVFRDAAATLALCLVDGKPDQVAFERAVGEAMREVRERVGHSGLRAYGEMVGILWEEGRVGEAVQLETYWNTLLSVHRFSLFCAYPIDILDPAVERGALGAVLCTHTHLTPCHTDLERAVSRAMNEVLGARVESLRHMASVPEHRSGTEIPRAEALILWLRSSFPDQAEEILDRARAYVKAA